MTNNKFAATYLETGSAGNLPVGHFINGTWTDGESGKKMQSFDPALAEPFGEFALGNASDMGVAISAAEEGAAHWRGVKPSERCRVLNEVARVLRANTDQLAFLESLDSGKTLAEAEGDVANSARLFEYYAGAADKLDGRSVNLGSTHTAFTVREPVGVTGHIIPWNYPTSTFARGVAPALAAGCSVVAKPAETTPYTALVMAALLSEAGVPDGVVNVVTGLGQDAGAAMVTDPRIKQLTFTGSVGTGIGVAQAAAPNVTRLTLELGGKSPVIVFDDSDIGAAIEGALWAIFSNSGQICSAGSRLLVQRSIRDEVIAGLLEKTNDIQFGHGLRNPDMGAINSELHLKRVQSHVEAAKARGCSILAGGEITTDPTTGKGWFFEPTVIGDLQPDDPAVLQEIFGPVLSVQVFETEEEAVRLANGTEFGLVAGVYTRDVGRAMRMASALDCGQVTINDYWAGGIELPFGGNGKSGYGREKGWEGLDAYTKVKSITLSME
ncbi:aldehyde dehydrogenase [Rhodobacterales bacterium 52_120_T64]|nr:aldehyde dehydrogenase [Rhodobacterales bacterium 52_120_T64]